MSGVGQKCGHQVGEAFCTGMHWDFVLNKDLKRAIRWYLCGARRGSCNAQYELGFMHLIGEGMPVDLDAGVYWMSAAASQEHGDAMRVLVDAHTSGVFGVEPNETLARRWSRKLAEYLASYPHARMPQDGDRVAVGK